LENRRPGEPSGFRRSNSLIQQVRFIRNADIIWVRVRPEHTTDQERAIIDNRLRPFRNRIPIINDISIFDNYDCKDKAFSIWKEHGIGCPDFLSFNVDNHTYNHFNVVEKVSKFLKKHEKILLRTNNETAANGMYVLGPSETKKDINAVLFNLEMRCKELVKNRKNTRIIATEFIKSQHSDGYIDLYRAHILLGKIISYYVVTNKKDIFHNVDMNEECLERFIQLNNSLCNKIEHLDSQIIFASKVLGCNLGAVEFFLIGDKPIFIELNPMWGGHASTFGFGDSKVQNYLDVNKRELISQIPNIYYWLDYPNYYKNLFELINSSF